MGSFAFNTRRTSQPQTDGRANGRGAVVRQRFPAFTPPAPDPAALPAQPARLAHPDAVQDL